MTKKKTDRNRITRGIVRFHTYVNLAATWLNALAPVQPPAGNPPLYNWQRIGWTAAELAAWMAFVTEDARWYPDWSNKKIRTTDMTDKLHANNAACRKLNKNNKLLDRIAASPNAVLMDFEVFNIAHNSPVVTGAATQRTGNIEDTVVVSVFYKGGGRIKFQCRPDSTAAKSHIPDGSDHLEIRVKLRKATDAKSTGPDDSTPKWNQLSTKAIVTIDFMPDNVGMLIDLYFRFTDSVHPNRNGPYTSMMTLSIP
ncbi:MAG TPA: hypothetical protein VF411_00630 [Bacteroidia bacterium]